MTSSTQSEPKILFVDDEQCILNALRRLTRKLAAQCFFVSSGEAALELLDNESVDIVVSDMKMPGMSGVQLLTEVAIRYPEIIRFVLTGYAEQDMVMGAINEAKVYGYLHKPWVNEEIIKTLENALQVRALLLERLLLQQMLARLERFNRTQFHGFIGDSPAMQLVYNTIELAGPSKASVFITGASGTGKEVAAESIHAVSPRSSGPFVAINCAAIPRDLIESELFGHVKGAFSGAYHNRDGAAKRADGGTLFLDELAEMDVDLQSKLLRFIQTGTYQKVGSGTVEKADLRFVCATNKNPEKAISEGQLREDLYYRLNVISIEMPDLCERQWDTVMLAEHFLKHYANEEGKVFDGFTADAERLIFHYAWPGNVRQLQNMINSAVILLAGPVVSALELGRVMKLSEQEREALLSKPLPFVQAEEKTVQCGETAASQSAVVAGQQVPDAQLVANGQAIGAAAVGPGLELKALSTMEREIIEFAVASHNGSVVDAARQLDVSPSTIYRKIQAWARH